ncbi:MAG: SCO family protein [Planctomycetes bacterium]|nr:SCO family protein [Planctomycetota bacterium]
MSGQEVVPPQSDAAEPGDGGSAMPTILLSVLSVLVLFGVLGGVALGIMLFGSSGSLRPAFLTWSEPAVPDPNYVAGPKLTEFTLTERSGDEFDSQSLKGKVWVASFFYASCPHTCFQLNQRVQQLEREFGKRGVTFLSITCDPKNDTPERLAKYAEGFEADEERWLFLTGDFNDIRRIGNDMFSAGVTKASHSERVYVVDKQGVVRGHFTVLDSAGFRLNQSLIQQLIDEPYEPPATADELQRDAPASPPSQAAGVDQSAEPAEGAGS